MAIETCAWGMMMFSGVGDVSSDILVAACDFGISRASARGGFAVVPML